MTTERRYNDDEVREIFERAAKGDAAPEQHALVPRDEGMSLAELQQIGREAGIEPALVAAAASSLDTVPAQLPRREMLGLPVGVGRVVDLPRAPSEREWELLVGELRQTFGARGRTEALGSSRSWVNGNLHAYVEPTEHGHRLRLGTFKGNAAPLTAASLVAIVTAVISGLTDPGGSSGLWLPAVLGGMGVIGLLGNVVRLPRWARRREEQMDRIAARAQQLLAPPPATSRTDA